MRMRSLSSLLLLALCCCPFASTWAANGWTLNTEPSSFFSSALLACSRYLPEFQAANPLPSYPNAIAFVNDSPGCTYGMRNGPGGKVLMSGMPWSVNGVNAIAQTYSCTAGETDSIQWPRGKAGPDSDVLPGTEVPIYSDVNLCVNGCIATTPDPVPDECSIIDTNVFCTWTIKRTGPVCQQLTKAPEQSAGCPSGYELSGNACVALPPVDPCIAEPTGEGCTGGGDTGGGDTGGGDTGGGDTGGGDTGGGDTGGGDTGGGDTGGGDTGGGDTGGGDTGGGDTGGNTGTAGGLGCKEAFVCSGDSVGCAMVQLQKIQRCESERGLDPVLAKSGVAETLKDPDGDIEEKEVQIASLLSGHARFLPSSCPPAQTFTVWGRQFAFKNDYFCNFATSMSWLVVTLASLFAAVYIGKSVGGS